MQRDPRARRTAAAAGLALLALAHSSAGSAGGQVREIDVRVLENAAIRGCSGCATDDLKRLISEASAALRMDQDDDGVLLIRVIPLLASAFSVSKFTIDGMPAELGDGAWTVQRPAKSRKKPPRIEVTCEDGQTLSFKPQHRPVQGPVGVLILPKTQEHPEADLSFHKRSFWADSLG